VDVKCFWVHETNMIGSSLRQVTFHSHFFPVS
jgi:hypothetical protein